MEHSLWWLEPVGVLVTAFATIVLARVTQILARETKRLAEIGQQPQIVPTIETSPRSMHWFDIHLENTGTATAFDIFIKLDPQPKLSRGDVVPFSNIPVLKPQQKLSSSLCDYADLENVEFAVIAEWSRSPGGQARESLRYNYSVKDFAGMSRLGDLPEIEMANSLKKLSEDFNRVSSGYNKLAVNVYSSDDRRVDREEHDKWRAEMRKKQAATDTSTDVPPEGAAGPDDK